MMWPKSVGLADCFHFHIIQFRVIEVTVGDLIAIVKQDYGGWEAGGVGAYITEQK